MPGKGELAGLANSGGDEGVGNVPKLSSWSTLMTETDINFT